jgi:hypothetical protein
VEPRRYADFRESALGAVFAHHEVVACELHPDNGGSPETMARLNAVRQRLKQFA